MGVDARMYVLVGEPALSERALRWLIRRFTEAFRDHAPFEDWTPIEVVPNPHPVQFRGDPVNPQGRGDIPEEVPLPGEDETLLYVKVQAQYHNEYLRGGLPLILSVARWFDEVFPGCTVYYGSDEHHRWEEFGEVARHRLWSHFCPKFAKRRKGDR